MQFLKNNKFWVFISVGSLLTIIILIYMLMSIPDRSKEIESLKLDKAKLEGQIQEIKKDNEELKNAYVVLETEKNNLLDSIQGTNKKIDKLKNDLKKSLGRIDKYDDAELIDFFSDYFDEK